MKKLLLLFAAILMASTGLWAETMDNVHYIDANGEIQTVDNVNIITYSSTEVTLGKAEQTTWYVVTDKTTLSSGVVCHGDVHLILGAELTVKYAGIGVSGKGNSLTIYEQPGYIGKLITTSELNNAGIGSGYGSIPGDDGSNITINGGWIIASGGENAAGIGGKKGTGVHNIVINGGLVEATGGKSGAGIGGGEGGSVSNITINRGTVTATGGVSGAGIGGGEFGVGSNITITGGTVTANGGNHAAGIGGGYQGNGSNITITGGSVSAIGGRIGTSRYASSIGGGDAGFGSNIFMPVDYRIKINDSLIRYDGSDLADRLAGKQSVEAYPDKYLNERNAAFAAIDAAVEGITDETICAMAATAREDVFQADDRGIINAVLKEALDNLQYVIQIYNSGKTAGEASAFGTLGTKQNGPAVILTDKDDKEFIFYSPKKVEYIKFGN